MASTYSTNLKLELQGTGENPGTWGTITNTNLGTALEQAIVGYGNPSYASDANLTLTYTDTNAAQTARSLVLNVTSAVSLTATRELVVPTIQKQYIVQNNTTGAQSITVKTSAGTGITVPNGRKAHLYVDGTNVIQMFDFVDINGGTIDGVTIGGASAGAGTFTTLAATTLGAALNANSQAITNANIDSGTIDGVTIGGASAGAGTFTNVTATGTINLSGATVSNGGSVTTVDINGGTIDGVTIGGSSAAAGTFTTLNATTIDATNLEVTNVKAKDGTAALAITDSTGKVTVSTELAVDNLNFSANAITSTNTNGNIDLTPNGTGEVNITKVDIDSGAIDGTAVGASSASTGVFTTLTATTLGGALNANSQAITNANIDSGTIDGVTLGTSSAVTEAQIDNINLNGNTISSTNTNGNLILAPNGTGNLGIGTSSPTQKLDILSAAGTVARIKGGSGTNQSAAFYVSKAGSASTLVAIGDRANILGGTPDQAASIYTDTGIPLTFDIAGTERMRLDSSGNLGLGVTPSGNYTLQTQINFSSGFKGAFLGGVAIGASGTGYPGVGYGARFTNTGDSYLYGVTDTASLVTFKSGGFQFLTAPSGTAGNAITFTQAMTLDASGNLGIGTTVGAASGTGLIIYSPTSTRLQLRNSTTGDTAGDGCGLLAFGSDLYVENRENGATLFFNNGSERARIDSAGNLGIGTSSPQARLHLYSASADVRNSILSSGVDDAAFQIAAWQGVSGSVDGTVIGRFGLSYSTTKNAYINFHRGASTTGGFLSFSTNDATERMRLDSSGNLGVGATSPQAAVNVERSSSAGTVAAGASIVLSNRNSASGTFVAGGVFSNTYRDITTSQYTAGVWFEKQNSAVSGTLASQGAIVFGTSDQNVGGNLPLERARIDSSGNLGLGVTPSAWSGGFKAIQYPGGSVASYASGTNLQIEVGNAYYQSSLGTYAYYNTGTAPTLYRQISGEHRWLTAPSGTAGNAITFTQAMTLDTAGNLTVGNIKLETGSGFGGINTVGATPLIFYTNSTEKARITSGGDLLVGTTAKRIDERVVFVFNGTTASGLNLDDSATTGTSNAQRFYRNAVQVGTITTTTTATAYNTSSDYRLKDNQQPLTGSGAFIDALQPKTWDWATNGSKGVGFIAHEVQTVSPNSVVGEKDAVDVDGNPIMQAMEYGSAEFIANIVAELQSLRARVATLENN